MTYADATSDTFIAYPDSSRAGHARFLEALATCQAEVLRSHDGPPMQFLVRAGCRRVFAELAGTATRPIVTEDAPRARVPSRRAA